MPQDMGNSKLAKVQIETPCGIVTGWQMRSKTTHTPCAASRGPTFLWGGRGFWCTVELCYNQCLRKLAPGASVAGPLDLLAALGSQGSRLLIVRLVYENCEARTDVLPRSVAGFISTIIALIVAITVHEFAHAWAANELGDPTSKNQGRLTLNPLSHLDPVGSLMIIFAGFGWGRPVPVNPYMLRTDPTVGMALVSFAGPASNLLTALLFAIPLRLGLLPPGLGSRTIPSMGSVFVTIIFINLALAVFNLIPLAPLDGYKVALAVLPRDLSNRLRRIEVYGPIILILLLFLPTVVGFDLLGLFMYPPIRFMFSLMTGS